MVVRNENAAQLIAVVGLPSVLHETVNEGAVFNLSLTIPMYLVEWIKTVRL